MSRHQYLARRILLSFPVLIIAGTIAFAMVYLGPIDPVVAILGQQYTPEAAAQIRENLGMNKPLWGQYINFMTSMFTLDLGQSWVINPGQSAKNVIWSYTPRTIWLGFWAVLVPLFIGIPMGFYAGLNSNSWNDYLTSFGGIVWRAMPNFWLAVILMTILSKSDALFGFDWAAWLVPTDIVTPPDLAFLASPADALFEPASFWWTPGDDGSFVGALKQILPAALVLGSASMGNEMRIGRTAVLETINSNYIETARAKGLTRRVIVWKHVFRNAMIPLVPIITSEAYLLLGGSVLVELVFAINGIGYLFLQSIISGDLPLAGTLIFLFSVLLIVINITQDFLYTVIDPRVGYQED